MPGRPAKRPADREEPSPVSSGTDAKGVPTPAYGLRRCSVGEPKAATRPSRAGPALQMREEIGESGAA